MGLKRQPMSLPLYKKAAATTDEIVSDPVKSGHLMCVQRIAYRDRDNAVTKITLLKRGRGVDFLLSETNTAIADVLYCDPYTTYFTEGEQIVVRFEVCTLNDNLDAYAHGWIAVIDDDPEPQE